jgi:hypothetical protein
MGTRVTRKLTKNSPNIWKCSQNCSQYIKAEIEHLHPNAFNVKQSTTKPCFETAYLAKNVKNVQVKSSQTAKISPNLVTLM